MRRGVFIPNGIIGLDLLLSEKVLLAVLVTYASKSGTAYASIETYGDNTGLSERCVRKCLRVLEKKAHIKPEGSKVGGRKRATVYRVLHDGEKPGTACPVSGGSKPGTECPKTRHGVSENPARKVDKGGTVCPQDQSEFRRTQRERLLSIAFGPNPKPKQRDNLEPVLDRCKHIPEAYLVQALQNRGGKAPWKALESALDEWGHTCGEDRKKWGSTADGEGT